METIKKDDTKVDKKESSKRTIAKLDHLIVQNDERYDIKKGDDISLLNIPERFYPNLKTEKII